MEQNTAALELLDLLATRNFDVKPTDLKTGNPPVNDKGKPDNSKANFFEFDFIGETGQNYGTVEIVLTDGVMTVASGNNTGRSMTDPVDKESWFDFLQQLKNFGVRNRFNRFDIENISRMKYLKQSIAQLTESFQGRGQYSWSGQPTEARMLIKHSHRLSETDARFRHIESIFIETTDGERYRLPTRSLSHGRAMLEHVRAGGRPWDARGIHINHMVEQLQILSRFRRAHQGRLFEGDAAALIDETNNYFGSLRRNIKSLATKSGYSRYFESWQPDSVADQELVVEDLRDLFVETRVDPRIEQALPLLAKIKENNMKEADIFEAWANRLTEGTWAIPDTEEKMTKLRLFLSQPQPVGADADRATSALGDILGDDNLFDRLEELAETDPDADARPVVQAWLKANANYPEVQAIQQELEQQPEVDQEISMTAQDMPDAEPNMREGDNLANPLEEVHSPGAMAMFPEEQGVAEALDPEKKIRLNDLIELYRDATEPNAYYDRDIDDPDEVIAMIRSEFNDKIADQVAAGAEKMHYPRHGIQRSDPLGGNRPVDRMTKTGKMYKQDMDFRKRMSKYRMGIDEQGVAKGSEHISSMIQQYEDMVELVYDLSPGRKKNIAIDKRDALEAQIEAMPGGKEALRKWAKSYNDAMDEGVAEGSNPASVIVKISGREYAAMSPEQKAAKQQEWQKLRQQAKKRLQNFTIVDTDKEKGVAEGPGFDKWADERAASQLHKLKKPHPETWHDVDPKLGKQVDKMSQAEKVKKGFAHPDTLKKKGVAKGSLMEDPVTAFASKAHDEWRQGWIKQNSGKSVPRIKKNSDGSEGDINVPFGKLHPDWQRENLAAGRAAMQAVKQFPNDIEKASEFIHNEWMKRNPKADYNAAQHVPYDQLPESEKEKDRVHVRTMMQLMGKQGVAEGRCNMSEAGVSCPVHGMTECYMETVQTDPKGFAQPTGAAFESQLARIKSLALLK